MNRLYSGVLLLAAVLLPVPAQVAGAQTAHSGALVGLGTGFSFGESYSTAVDGSGNVYVADYGKQAVEEIPAGCSSPGCVTTLPVAVFNPRGVAVDGSGNVFVAEARNSALLSEVIKISAGCNSSSCTKTTLPGSYTNAFGVAVDESGNAYVADYGLGANQGTVKEIPSGCAVASCITILGGTLNEPVGAAVDSSGNVYVTESGNNDLKEIPAGCTSASCVATVGGGFNGPSGVAVDGSGNIFVADSGNNAVKEMLPGCTSASCVTTLGGSYGVSAIGYYYFGECYGVAVDANGNVYFVSWNATNSIGSVSEVLIGTRFPATAVGSASAIESFYFTFLSSGQIGAAVVLTQGATGLDFYSSTTSSTSCTTGHTYNVGDVCNVEVRFKPAHPGQRIGSVQLTTTTGTPIATAYASGIGVGTQVVFPGTRGVLMPTPKYVSGVAVDGSENVYVAVWDTNLADGYANTVTKHPAGCTYGSCQSTPLGGGFNAPMGLAVDGSGNVFVGDYGNNAVKEIPPGCTSSSCVTTLGGGFNGPMGVAVDGSGNVFVGDYGNGAVKEIPAGCISAACVTTLGGGFGRPSGVAVDGSGNVFVGDSSADGVKEVPHGCTSVSCVATLGGGFKGTLGLAVDGSGSIFVEDQELTYFNVKKVPPGCNSSSCVALISYLAGGGAAGIAVGGSGNLFLGDRSHYVTMLDFADAPSLTFVVTDVGTTSSDSPQIVTIGNDGNSALIFQVPSSGSNPSISPNFTLESGDSGDCPLVGAGEAAQTLAAGASCTLPVSFTPASLGPLGGSLTITDNNLNASPGATQTIWLEGGGQPVTATTLTISPTTIAVGSTSPITLTATVAPTSPGSQPEPYPTGTVAFFTPNNTLLDKTLSQGKATAFYDASSLPTGTYTIMALYYGDLFYSVFSDSASVTLTVASSGEATPSVTVTPASFSITTAQNLSVTVSVSGGSYYPTPTGSVTLKTFSSRPYTSTTATLSNGSVTINIPAGSLDLGIEALGASYTPDSASSSTYNSATGMTSVTVTTPQPMTTPTITVTPFSNSITTAQSLSVAVAVIGGSGTPTPTGSITLTSTSRAETLSHGSASFFISPGLLRVGIDTLTATYTPDSASSLVYTGATGTASVTVTSAASASFVITGTAVSVSRGARTGNTSTVTVTPAGGFTGNVTLTAAITSSPTGATNLPTLSFGSTTPVNISGTAAGTATLTISTTAASSAAIDPRRSAPPWWYATGGATLACILLIFIPARRRNWHTTTGALLLLLVFFGVSFGGILACGGGAGNKGDGAKGGGAGTGNFGTTAGSYTLTITATSGTITSTGSVALTVQ